MANCNSLDTNLTDKITCYMCNSLYTDPKILPCCHYYCRSCLERETGESEVLVCPKCNQRNKLSSARINRLPNAFIDSEIKVLHSVMSRALEDKPKMVCGLCKNPSFSPAQAYCHRCAMYLCSFCKEAHDRLKPYENHVVMILNDMTLLTSEHLDLLEAPVKMICPEHDEDSKIYCFDCDQLICRDCVVKDHRDHNYDFVKKISESIKKELHSKQESLQDSYAFLGNIRANIEERIMQIKHDGLDATDFVNQSFDIVLYQFEKYRSNLLMSIQNKVEADQRELKTKKRSIDSAQKNIQMLMSSIQDTIENTRREQMILTHKRITEQISKKENMCCKMSEEIKLLESSFVVYKTSCARIIGAIGDSLKSADPIMCSVEGIGAHYAEVGRGESFVVHVTQSNEVPCQAIQNVQVELSCIDDCTECNTQVEIIKGCTYRVSYTPKVQGQHLLKIRVNERPIVGNPFEVLVKKPLMEMNDPMIVIEGVKKLGDLAIRRDGSIIATQYETGAVISLDKKGKHIKSILRGLGMPFGIATNSAGEIFITQNKKCRLLKYSKDLKLIEAVGCKEGTLGNFTKPGRLTINKRSEVFVCDVRNSRIQVFDDDLEYLRWFSISKPTGASVDNQGDILVVEQGKNSLCKIFDTSKLGTSKIIERLANPQGVYVDNEYIFVTEKGSAQVSVFNHDGTLVTTLGRGTLKDPGAIIGDEDGYLYVCDEELEAICVF